MPQPLSAFPSDTQLLTLQLQRQGLSVAEIAQQRGFSPSTIINHLLAEMRSASGFPAGSSVRQHLIVKAMEIQASLKSIYEHLKLYLDEIRLVRAWWQEKRR